MSKIEVYSSLWCPFCARAKALLDHKGVTYEEIDVDNARDVAVGHPQQL